MTRTRARRGFSLYDVYPGKVIEGTLTANTAAPMVAGNQ
jgi:hypothetical protein